MARALSLSSSLRPDVNSWLVVIPLGAMPCSLKSCHTTTITKTQFNLACSYDQMLEVTKMTSSSIKSSGLAWCFSAFCCRDDTKVDGVQPEDTKTQRQHNLLVRVPQCCKYTDNHHTLKLDHRWFRPEQPLTFFSADCVEIASGEASSERPMEPLVSALLILHCLLVQRDGFPQWLVCNTDKQSWCWWWCSACRLGSRISLK